MSRSILSRLFAATLCALLLAGIACAQEAAFPTLRIPKFTDAPTLDGAIRPGEWDQAAAFTGLTSGALGGGIVPNIQQVTFYLGYDHKYLYLAMRSPHREGTYPKARVKQNDVNNALLFEDHIEWQILKHARNLASRPGFGFYKILANARGAKEDKWWYNGTDGTELLWDTNGTTRCTVTPTHWDLEMSVEIAQLDETSLDGKDWVMALVRSDSCEGVYFTTWGNGHTWMAWKDFPQTIFDPAVAAVQLRSLGDLMEGDLGAQLALTSPDGRPHTVTATVKVFNAAGAELFGDTKTVEVPAGGRRTADFTKAGLALDEKGNSFLVDVREGDKILYRIQTPVTRLSEAYKTKFLDPWLAARPQSGDWDYAFAYWPYYNVAECSVDLDFFGVPAEIHTATSFNVEVYPKKRKGGKPLSKTAAPIDKLAGSIVAKLPALKDGDYIAIFTLYHGKKKIAEKTANFVRKHYPWEHNTLGISDEVIPPYLPITTGAEKNTDAPLLNFWARTYRIGPAGLPEQMTVSRKELGMHNNPILRGARLEVTADGTPLTGTPTGATIAAATPAEVKVTGGQDFGRLTTAVNATAEYDGWYEVALTLNPTAKTTVDTVDLVLDLGAYPDTFYTHRGGDGRTGNTFSNVPAGQGVVWKSTDLPSFTQWGGAKHWKNFIPVAFLGTGSRGLWFYAWSDAGWQVTDDDAALRVERDAKGQVSLRVRFIAGGAALDAPRTLRFALLGAPVKPLPENYRNWQMNHDTSGYRYYGDSVDGYALPDPAHYDLQRKTMLYGPQTELARKTRAYLMGRTVAGTMVQGQPNVMYGSTYMTGMGMEEFDTFGGEWLGRSNWEPKPDLKFNGLPNYAGSIVWDTPRKMSPTGVNFAPSMVDNFVWYHQKLLEIGINGTWMDNASIGVVKTYDPARHEMVYEFNAKIRREQMKRLNVLGWQQMRVPCWITNLHDDFSWSQTAWLVENDWYIDAEGMDYLDHMTLDAFRAMACPKTMQLPAKPWLSGGSAKTLSAEVNTHIERSKWGICLLHDVHNNLPDNIHRELNYFLDFDAASRCSFRGYFDLTPKLLDTGHEAVKASLYTNATRKNVVIVLLNAGEQPADLQGLSFALEAIKPGTLNKAYDPDTGAPVRVTLRDGRYVLDEPYPIARHGVRLLAVGAEE